VHTCTQVHKRTKEKHVYPKYARTHERTQASGTIHRLQKRLFGSMVWALLSSWAGSPGLGAVAEGRNGKGA